MEYVKKSMFVTGGLFAVTLVGIIIAWSSWFQTPEGHVDVVKRFGKAEYVATAGQTTFTGNDANGLALSYTVGSIIVTLNGVKLRPGDDYTATSGNSVVLGVAAAAGDELVIDAFATFDIAKQSTDSLQSLSDLYFTPFSD